MIELLVVIAIISMLAAILFPVFATAREKARQATCASNERQLGIAFTSYAQDYDEVYPFGSDHFTAMSWDVEIEPYALKYGVSDLSIFHCPDDLSLNTQNGLPTRTYAMVGAVYNSVYAFSPSGYNQYSCPLSEIGSPSGTFLLTEACDTGSFVTDNAGAIVHCPINSGICPGQDQSSPGRPFHSGGWNYVYCDGHVKWMTPESTIRTPGVTYPVTITIPEYNPFGPGQSWQCPGTALNPCGPWTIADND